MYGARQNDPVTSHLSALDTDKRASQRDRILLAYHLSRKPLTDEEAAEQSGANPRSCWWKRSSELREQGYIDYALDDNQAPVIVMSSQDRPVHACRITTAGVMYLRNEGWIN